MTAEIVVWCRTCDEPTEMGNVHSRLRHEVEYVHCWICDQDVEVGDPWRYSPFAEHIACGKALDGNLAEMPSEPR